MATPTPRHHIYRQFDQDLADIQSQALKLGGLAENQIGLAVKALSQSDLQLAEQVINGDDEINHLEVHVNQLCLQILARRQPAAGDLRLVVAVIKAVNDLERIGDDAKRIAHITIDLADTPPQTSHLQSLVDFSEGILKLLHQTLDSFARIDPQAAMRTKQLDRELDAQYGMIMHNLIAAMTEDPRTIPNILKLMWTARALERIGDRACNICEYTVYYALGKDIRHLSPEQEAELDWL